MKKFTQKVHLYEVIKEKRERIKVRNYGKRSDLA